MGFLSDPKTRHRLMNIVLEYNNKLCFVCYVAGVAWFLALAYNPLNAKTYFSENALLPGLVKSDQLTGDSIAVNYLKDLRNELRINKKNTGRLKIPSNWLESRLRELGLDTYVQNFTFTYPAGILKHHSYEGHNVYAILRASKTASTEALVLSIPFRSTDSTDAGITSTDSTNAGIALMLHLAKLFRKHTYWAKDIIFLVTEHEEIGIQAWLSAYHHSRNEYILAGELAGRGGSIQAALNLEIAHEEITRFNIKLEGLNGQLPNLDLVTTAMQLCRNQGIQPTLQKQTDHWDGESYAGFRHSLKTMLLMMRNLAHGSPTGNHGLFHRYNIEAVTLQSVRIKNARHYFRFTDMTSVVEGIFRSLNNLLERFHQSFFFYLLPSTNRYISIGLYMPPFAVLALPIVLKAVALWISVTVPGSEREGSCDMVSETNETKATGDCTGEDNVEDIKDQAVPDKPAPWTDVGLMSLLPTFILCLAFGLSAHLAPRYFIDAADGFGMTAAGGLAVGTISIHLAAIGAPWMLHRKVSQGGDVDGGPDWRMLKSVSLLTLAIVLAAMSALNIAMSFFIVIVWSPVILLVRPTHSRLVNWMQFLLLLLVSPLGLLYIGCIVNEMTVARVVVTWSLFSRAWHSAQSALLMSLISNKMFANWTFSLVSLIVFPTWLLFWSLMWAKRH